MNVSETDRAIAFSFEMPGLDEDKIDVQLLGKQLTVSAERTLSI